MIVSKPAQNQNGISCCFSSQNSSQICFYWISTQADGGRDDLLHPRQRRRGQDRARRGRQCIHAGHWLWWDERLLESLLTVASMPKCLEYVVVSLMMCDSSELRVLVLIFSSTGHWRSKFQAKLVNGARRLYRITLLDLERICLEPILSNILIYVKACTVNIKL